MKVLAVSILFVWALGCALPLIAQEQAAKIELYGGYDYVRFNANPRISGVPPSESVNGNGLSGQFIYNPSTRLGVVAELSGYAVARQGFATTHEVSYLFGPRVNLRRSRVTPFAQVLLGRVWAEDGITFGSVTSFGTTIGGGIDVSLSRHIALRPIQAEYLLSRFPDGNNDLQNSFRFGAGVVFRFAK